MMLEENTYERADITGMSIHFIVVALLFNLQWILSSLEVTLGRNLYKEIYQQSSAPKHQSFNHTV